MKLLKRKSLCIGLVMSFFSLQILSGGSYSSNEFIIIDSVINVSYYSVSDTAKKSYFSDAPVINIQINDIKKKQIYYIFPKNNTDTIEIFLFEEKLDKENNKVLYLSSSYYDSSPSIVKNNVDIAADRKISDNMIIQTKNKKGEIKFWICNKMGDNLKNVYKYSEKEHVRYYIDAKLKKLILIKQVGAENIITEIDY